MPETARLGQSESGLGDFPLGMIPASLPVNPVQTFTPTRFTGQLGTPLSYPANIVPGSAFFRLGMFFGARLSFIGHLYKNLRGRILFSIPGIIIVQTRPAKLISQIRPIILKVVQRTTSQLDSLPKDIDIAVSETYPYTVDVANYLASGDTISIVIAVLTYQSTGAIVTSAWQGTISTSGTIIQVPINGPVLQLGQSYQLAVTFTAASGKRLTETSNVNVIA